jgi:hypothetical protein
MQVRIRETGAVMYEAEFRAYEQANGGPSWDRTTTEVLEALGADVVFEGPQAQPTRYQIAFADGVKQLDGKWYTKYSVADIDAEAIAIKDAEQAKNVRQQRDEKLKETDWRFRSDMNPSQDWVNYCQALRDVPLQSGFPWEINWPTQPE